MCNLNLPTCSVSTPSPSHTLPPPSPCLSHSPFSLTPSCLSLSLSLPLLPHSTGYSSVVTIPFGATSINITTLGAYRNHIREAMRHPLSVKCCTCGPDVCMQCYCHMHLDRMCGCTYVRMYVRRCTDVCGRREHILSCVRPLIVHTVCILAIITAA